MSSGAQINYKEYAEFMREALSGPEICQQDFSLNHGYFNTKKGYFWSEEHHQQLIEGVLACGLEIPSIRELAFANQKTEMEV